MDIKLYAATAGLPDAEKGSGGLARSPFQSASQAVRGALCGHRPLKGKDCQAMASDTVNAPSDAQPMSPAAPEKEAAEQEHSGKANSMVSSEPVMARVRRAAKLEHSSKSSLRKRKADANATPVKSNFKKAATAAATPTKKQQLGKFQHSEKKKTYQAKTTAQATGAGKAAIEQGNSLDLVEDIKVFVCVAKVQASVKLL